MSWIWASLDLAIFIDFQPKKIHLLPIYSENKCPGEYLEGQLEPLWPSFQKPVCTITSWTNSSQLQHAYRSYRPPSPRKKKYRTLGFFQLNFLLHQDITWHKRFKQKKSYSYLQAISKNYNAVQQELYETSSASLVDSASRNGSSSVWPKLT